VVSESKNLLYFFLCLINLFFEKKFARSYNEATLLDSYFQKINEDSQKKGKGSRTEKVEFCLKFVGPPIKK